MTIRPSLVLSLVLVIIASIGIPGLIVRWFVASRLYGGVPFSLIPQMNNYVKRCPQRAGVGITGSLSVISIVAINVYLIFGWPIEFPIVCIAALIYFSTGTGSLLLPPSVLYLSVSSNQSTLLFTSLANRLRHLRFLTLIRPSGEVSPTMTINLKMNTIRTFNDVEWRSTVFHLMDVVPLIVMDKYQETPQLYEEFMRIKQKGYQARTILIRQPTSPNDLAQLIEKQLREPIDLANRLKRQDEFARMFKHIPPSLHNPNTVADCVRKARAIEYYAMCQFLKNCKKPGSHDYGSRILEDLPSKVTREEEKEYLSSCRALEEAEIILKSVLEDEEKSSEEFRDINIAIALNGIGRVERLKCNWEQAIKYLDDAIQRLKAIVVASRPDGKSMIHAELATAHFNMGDTLMARYRDEKNDSDRQNAIRHFEKTLRIDVSLGGDQLVTKERLKALATQ